MSSSAQESSSIPPKWATKRFGELLDHYERWIKLIAVISEGMAILPLMPSVVASLLKSTNPPTVDRATKKIESAKAVAETAKAELDAGIPLLHAHAAAGFWSELEAAVRMFVAQWLEMMPGAMTAPAIKKLSVKIGEYESLSQEERFLYIVERLESETSAKLKPGVGRFEVLLDAIGLSGEVPQELRKGLLELSQARNLLMHRSGVVDRRFSEACPWLNLSPGDIFQFNSSSTYRYSQFVIEYVLLLAYRIDDYFKGEQIAEENGT